MSLVAGTRLGPYEILSPIGAGGMGEVYRAKDTKLKRDVAIKVLPESVAGDAERLARFEREAQSLAALNHPNIAAVYAVEGRAIVMELVEGEDLSALIARGSIAISEALPIAKQIADALEAAHEQGIIHRDLKPANIKVRGDRTVKVLDFGLAKAMAPSPPFATAGTQGQATDSPTMTSPAMTAMGMILGTAAYMSPEQAKGRAVDKRTDIWAFGVVLYEMLSGRRLFDARDVSETLAAVLTRDVSLTALPSNVPPRLRTLISDCLVRDPKQRLRDIGDARLVLDKIIAGAPDDPVAVTAAPAASLPSRALPWVAAGLLAVALGIALWAPWRVTPSLAPRRLLAALGADASFSTGLGPTPILSPDGMTLAFVGQQGGASRLFVRKLDQLQALPLPGTEGATSPFFSPNGQWIAFFASAALKKVAVTGGAPIQVCEAPAGRGGTWSDEDMIYFTPSAGPNVTIMRVAAAGGTPVAAGVLSAGAISQRWPQVLPGGAGVLFSEHSASIDWDSANIVVMPLQGGTPKVVVPGGYFGRYVTAPTRAVAADGGYLLYMQHGTVFGVPFDLTRLEITGPAEPVIDGVAAISTVGSVQLDVATDGTLVYVPGYTSTNAIDWVTRDGRTSPLRAAKADWASPRFSPDGQRLAIDIGDGKQRDIWVYEWSRDTLTQITFDPHNDTVPVWTPDGQHIVFASDRAKKGVSNMYWVNADGTGEVTRLTDSPYIQVPHSWHPSGKFLAFSEQNTATGAATGFDLMILPMDGDAARGWTPGKPRAFLATPSPELLGMFSPDGRWIAYMSTEHTGVYDVYVRPFPGPGGQWLISMGGGGFPRWSKTANAKTANELLFFGGGKINVAPFTVVDDSFRADKPRPWTPAAVLALSSQVPYDIHPDGKRLAAIANADAHTDALDKVVFVFNFFDYLKSMVSSGKR